MWCEKWIRRKSEERWSKTKWNLFFCVCSLDKKSCRKTKMNSFCRIYFARKCFSVAKLKSEQMKVTEKLIFFSMQLNGILSLTPNLDFYATHSSHVRHYVQWNMIFFSLFFFCDKNEIISSNCTTNSLHVLLVIRCFCFSIAKSQKKKKKSLLQDGCMVCPVPTPTMLFILSGTTRIQDHHFAHSSSHKTAT